MTARRDNKPDESIRLSAHPLALEDVELRLRIRRTPGEYVVFEIRDGQVFLGAERAVVRDVPFQTKQRRKR